jgi:glycosyltransferase involved in cell wall biosynthesis
MNHIALVTTSYPDTTFQSGQEAAGAFVADFAAELAKHLRVTVIAPGGQNSREATGNVTVERFAVPRLPLSLLRPMILTNWRHILITIRAGQLRLTEVVSEQPIDHILACWVLPSGYWARLASQSSGIPYSTWALGSDIWSLGKVPVVRHVLRTVLRDSRHRFADGLGLAHDVEKIGGLQCQFLPSSRQLQVGEKRELANEPPYNLAFLGRWHPNKGIDLLLESLGQLSNTAWHRIRAVRICGGGPLEAIVNEKCSQLRRLGHPITVSGYLGREEAVALYRWADYLMLPSRIESIPVLFSDGMQANCPLISTPVGDLPRLMSGDGVGVLADTVSASAYARAIGTALELAPASFGPGLSRMREQFTVAASVNQFLACLLGSPR